MQSCQVLSYADIILDDSILYEFLGRLLQAYPPLDLALLDSYDFLPITSSEIANLPIYNDMIPFPSSVFVPSETEARISGNFINPLVEARRSIGEPSYRGVLKDQEASFCPMACCDEYDCQVHS